MANKKISELNEATSVDVTNKLAIVQSGETKFVQVNTLLSAAGTTIRNYLTPTSITMSVAGGTIDLNDSAYATSEIIKLSWSGATGTVELTLPDATSSANTYRVLRIISNGGFTNSTHVDITPRAGQTLDGSSSYFRINRSYEGVTVWSDGTEWYVIQSKS